MEGTIRAALVGDISKKKPGFIKGISMNARVVAPDKSEVDVPLWDNGTNHDGESNDGIYAAPFLFTLGGGYSITVTAAENKQGPVLEKTIGYFQARAKDNDFDRLPDDWERQYFPRNTH